MSNKAKQRARRKRYQKAMNFKKNCLPDKFKGMRITSKLADRIFYASQKRST